MTHSLSGAMCASVAGMALVVGGWRGEHAPLCVDLVAETAPSVGRVCVTERADSLIVRFETAGEWRLAETHLAIAPSLEEIPQGGAHHPILGRFPYKGEHGRGVSAFEYAVPNANAPRGSTGSRVIAAHAEVVRGGQSEGAWGKGLAFTDGGMPASYFVYPNPETAKPPS